jgi:hypothetical protein
VNFILHAHSDKYLWPQRNAGVAGTLGPSVLQFAQIRPFEKFLQEAKIKNAFQVIPSYFPQALFNWQTSFLLLDI